MRAEFVPVITEDFGVTGMHKADRVMPITHPQTGEQVGMRMTSGIPSVLYLNESVIWVAGNMQWTLSVGEYNELTAVTDRIIGQGRASADLVDGAHRLDGTPDGQP